jgi:hypothetical protein
MRGYALKLLGKVSDFEQPTPVAFDRAVVKVPDR